jgi:preprotein translocase subunit YajC
MSSLLLPMIAVFAIFYVVVLRPQQQKIKEHRAIIDAVKRGDTVVTAGGLIGKVVRVGTDGEVKVEIAEGVQVRVLKATLTEVRGRGEPVKAKAEADGESGGGTQPGA